MITFEVVPARMIAQDLQLLDGNTTVVHRIAEAPLVYAIIRKTISDTLVVTIHLTAEEAERRLQEMVAEGRREETLQ